MVADLFKFITSNCLSMLSRVALFIQKSRLFRDLALLYILHGMFSRVCELIIVVTVVQVHKNGLKCFYCKLYLDLLARVMIAQPLGVGRQNQVVVSLDM